MSTLDALFAPGGIVVVGASRVPGKLGTAMSEAISAGPTPVALVNRSGGEGMEVDIAAAAALLARRGAHADLVISCVPAAATPPVIEDAAAAGIGAALVCAGGFAEIGAAGMQVQAALAEAAQRSGVRVLGPNTSGFLVPGRGLRASFVPGAAQLEPGRVAVIASSGGVNHMVSFRLARAGAGVSLAVGIGAGFDVTHAEVLDHAREDAATAAIALHLESVMDGLEVLDAVRRAAAVKPVVAYVVGRRAGSAFAQSHTGALATSWRTTRSLLAQAGAVLVDDEDELVTAVTVLAGVRLPPNRDPGAALITGQAGPGLIIDDHAEKSGWRMPRLSDATRSTLATLLPPLTFQDNPVDTGRPGDTFPAVVHAVAADPAIDVVGIYALTEPVVDLPRAVVEAKPDVPVVLCVDGPADEVADAVARARTTGVPLVQGASTLAAAIDALVRDARQRALRDDDATAAEPLELDASGPWDEVRAKDLLDRIGIRTPPRRRVLDALGARTALGELGGKVAVKLIDATVLHKTDIGGVRLGVSDPDESDEAIRAITSVGGREFLIERMADPGVDLIVAVRRDPVFGPVTVIGLGGTGAEAGADIAIRGLPLGPIATAGMIDELRGRALLHGWRGGPQIDVAALSIHLAALATVLDAAPGILEIEINPLRVTAQGLIALDAVITTQ